MSRLGTEIQRYRTRGPGPLVVFGVLATRSRPSEADHVTRQSRTKSRTCWPRRSQSLGLELLGAEYLPAPGSAVLRLYIDVPAGRGRRGRAALGHHRGLRGGQPRGFRAARCRGSDQPATTRWKCPRRASTARCSRRRSSRASSASRRRSALKLPQDGRRRLQGKIDARRRRAASCSSSTATSSTVRVRNIDKARLVPDWAALGFAAAPKRARARRAEQAQAEEAARRTAKKQNQPNRNQPSRRRDKPPACGVKK